MHEIVKIVYNHFLNQPAPVGIIVIIVLGFHNQFDKLRWKQHDREAGVFRDRMEQMIKVVEKVDRYLLKHEAEYK